MSNKKEWNANIIMYVGCTFNKEVENMWILNNDWKWRNNNNISIINIISFTCISLLSFFICLCVYIWKDLHFIEYNKKNMFYTMVLIIGHPLLLVDLN